MGAVPDQENRSPFGCEPARLEVHLAHKRTGRVDHVELAAGGLRAHRRRDAVRREDDRRTLGDLTELVDEDRPAPLEAGDDVLVVHDLPADVDGCAVLGERQLDDLDRAFHPGTERARRSEHDRARSQSGRPLGEQRRSPRAALRSARRPAIDDTGVGEVAAVGVDDDSDDRERPPARGCRKPGRLHVERERSRRAPPALTGALDAGARRERTDVDAQTAATEGGREQRAAGYGDRFAAVGEELGSADDVARSQTRRDPRAETGDRDRGGRPGACGERRGRGACARGPMPVRTTCKPARRRGERELLDAERDEHEERAAHRAAPRIRPSAITGNTSR